MRYLVMECHPGYVVVLDEEGRFFKAANLCYEVGQTVCDPVLMRDAPEKQRHTIRRVGSRIAAIAACFLLFFGFHYYRSYLEPYSSIYLTINPEVQMDLNRQGTVVGLKGTNEDGETLLEGYDGKGKDKVTVADELIDRAIDMGFLSDGRQISFSIDSPDEALFQEYGTELRTEVTEHLAGRITITIEIVDYNNERKGEDPADSSAPASSQPAAPSGDMDNEDTDYSPNNDGVTDYADTDYGPNNDGVTDYDDDDYGENGDDAAEGTLPAGSTTEPADTDYGSGSDGVTDYSDGSTDYDPGNAGSSNYDDNDDSGDDDGGDDGYDEDDSDEDD